MEVVNRNRSAPFITKDGSEIRSILDRTTSGVKQQSLAEATLPPGAETATHRHRRTEELYYVLRGRGIMTLGGQSRAVGPGDGVLIPPGTPHSIRTVGRRPLVFLCCCAPPYSHADTILVGAPRQAAQEGQDARRRAGCPADARRP
jgi:mannose-6-phosphate isomerase-like protein (cupin superfamily)